VGIFDGLHDGHRHVIAVLRDAAERSGLETALVTFDPHPLALVAPGHAPRLLTGMAHRLELVAEAGLELAAVVPFDDRMRRSTAAAFAGGVLSSALHARLVVVGEDFRFGHQRTGNVASLAELGDAHGFATEVVPLVGGQAPVSSTRIRALVAAGDLGAVADALGRHHEVRGAAFGPPGERSGRPAVGVAVPSELALPPAGAYAVRVGPVGRPLARGVAYLEHAGEVLRVLLLEPPVGAPDEVYRVVLVARLGEATGDREDRAAADLAAAREALG
jgi:riboflavin kinase/FMN adenylyltransferase